MLHDIPKGEQHEKSAECGCRPVSFIVRGKMHYYHLSEGQREAISALSKRQRCRCGKMALLRQSFDPDLDIVDVYYACSDPQCGVRGRNESTKGVFFTINFF